VEIPSTGGPLPFLQPVVSHSVGVGTVLPADQRKGIRFIRGVESVMSSTVLTLDQRKGFRFI
jgi:hypothetical protein